MNKKIIYGIIIVLIVLSVNSINAKNQYGYNYGDIDGVNAFDERLASSSNRVISYEGIDGYYRPILVVHDDVKNNTCYLYGTSGISCVKD